MRPETRVPHGVGLRGESFEGPYEWRLFVERIPKSATYHGRLARAIGSDLGKKLDFRTPRRRHGRDARDTLTTLPAPPRISPNLLKHCSLCISRFAFGLAITRVRPPLTQTSLINWFTPRPAFPFRVPTRRHSSAHSAHIGGL